MLAAGLAFNRNGYCSLLTSIHALRGRDLWCFTCKAVQHFRNQQICHINFLKILNIVSKDYSSTSSFHSQKYHMPNLKALQHRSVGKPFHSYYYFKLEVHLRHKIKATVICAEYQYFLIWKNRMAHKLCLQTD